MNYSKIKNWDIANGAGIRVSVWVSGCSFHCPDCFNGEAWDFESGQKWSEDTITEIIKLCENPHIKGLSILGGEPLHPYNCGGIFNLVRRFKSHFGTSKDIWLWTGYEVDINDAKWGFHDGAFNVIKLVDRIVDGRFDKDKKSNQIKFRGSNNQRIWAWRGDGYGEQLVDVSDEYDKRII